MKNSVIAFSVASVLLTSLTVLIFKTGMVAALTATSTSATSTDAEASDWAGQYRELDAFLVRIKHRSGGKSGLYDGNIDSGRARHRQCDIDRKRLVRYFIR